MVDRNLFIFFVIAMFSLGLTSAVFPVVGGEEVRGMVTKIDGGKVSIKDSTGDERTMEPINPEALSTLKVGDRALVKDGILIKDGGAMPSSPSRVPKY